MRKKLTRLIKKLCDDFGADYEMIDTKTRKSEIVRVKQIVYYFLKEETKISLGNIGAIFNQDHATVLHGHKTICNLFDTHDKKFLDWHNLNQSLIRQLIDIALNGNVLLIRKKYRHYYVIEMISQFFGEEEAIRFEKYLIKKTIQYYEQL